MKKRNVCIIIIVLLLSSLLAYSQNKNRRYVSPPSGRSLGEEIIIDTSFIKVYYAMNADNVRNQNTYLDFQCLEIGKKYAKYYSLFLKDAEETQKAWIREHPQAQSIQHFFPKNKYGVWSEYQYSDFFIHQGVLTEYSTMPFGLEKENAVHKEPYPKQQWEIQTETCMVCNTLCQKATCHFSGRDFTAWFACKIPIKYGPWKFGGLPGIIMKVEDSNRLYSFECVKIEKSKAPIISHEYGNYKEKKRADILKLQRLANEDWLKTIGFCNMKGEAISKFVPYEPLELK